MNTKPSPADLQNILYHANADDLPAGVSLHDTSNADTRRVVLKAGECTLATVHQHWRANLPTYYVNWDFQKRESEVDALLHRIANATNARLSQNKSEADAVLDRLNLRA